MRNWSWSPRVIPPLLRTWTFHCFQNVSSPPSLCPETLLRKMKLLEAEPQTCRRSTLQNCPSLCFALARGMLSPGWRMVAQRERRWASPGRVAAGWVWEASPSHCRCLQPPHHSSHLTNNRGISSKRLAVLATSFVVGSLLVYNGAIYITAQARPAPGLAPDGHGLVQLPLQSGPDLDQKFHVIIAANMSPFCCTSRLKLQCPRQPMTYG